LDLFDFTSYPKLTSWLSRMKSLPGYAETHNEVLDGMRVIMQQAKEKAQKAAASAKL
jgi:hypothetical protein